MIKIGVCQTAIYPTNFFRESDWFKFSEILYIFFKGSKQMFCQKFMKIKRVKLILVKVLGTTLTVFYRLQIFVVEIFNNMYIIMLLMLFYTGARK